MKIRLGLLDDNTRYIQRLSTVLGSRFSDKLSVVVFSSFQSLEDYLEDNKLDVLLAGDHMVPEDLELPDSMIMAFLSNSFDIQTINGVRTVCRYQKAEQFYRDVLCLYAEIDQQTGYKMSEDACPMILCQGSTGGTGTTAVAAACSIYFANKGKRVLYLNLEENGVIEHFFSADGQSTLSDVLYAIKGKQGNLFLKMESMVRRDDSGVYFYAPFNNLLDEHELTADNVNTLVNTITKRDLFDYVIVDCDSTPSPKRRELMDMASRIVLVCNGTESGNLKLERRLQEFALEDEHNDTRIMSKIGVIYNRFGTGCSRSATPYQENVLGVIQEVPSGTQLQVINEIARQSVFEKLSF